MAASYERFCDMPMDARAARATGCTGIPRWLAHLLSGIVGAAFRVAFRYRVDGVCNIRDLEGRRGAVVIGNHVSFLDVVFMFLAARPRQWIRFMARDSLFTKANGLLGHILARVGAFPVKRDSADRTSVKRAVCMVKNGELVGVMPEGTRRGKGSKPPEIHAGVALIAKMAKAPIVPMTARNAENIKRAGQRLRFPKVTIEFGDPILVSDFDFLLKEDRLDGCAWYAMREVFALNRRIPANQVDMRALFPEGRDFTEVFEHHEIPHHTAAELAAGHDVWSLSGKAGEAADQRGFSPDAAADAKPAQRDSSPSAAADAKPVQCVSAVSSAASAESSGCEASEPHAALHGRAGR